MDDSHISFIISLTPGCIAKDHAKLSGPVGNDKQARCLGLGRGSEKPEMRLSAIGGNFKKMSISKNQYKSFQLRFEG
jgi:hypothetical protein